MEGERERDENTQSRILGQSTEVNTSSFITLVKLSANASQSVKKSRNCFSTKAWTLEGSKASVAYPGYRLIGGYGGENQRGSSGGKRGAYDNLSEYIRGGDQTERMMNDQKQPLGRAVVCCRESIISRFSTGADIERNSKTSFPINGAGRTLSSPCQSPSAGPGLDNRKMTVDSAGCGYGKQQPPNG